MDQTTKRSLNFVAIESEPFAQVSYLLWLEDQDGAIVVDPGFDTNSILNALQNEQRQLSAILNTHGHCDHIVGNETIKRQYPSAPLMIGRNDATMLSDPYTNLSALFGQPMVSPPADILLDDGQTFEVAGFVIEVREIPGHSPGSVVFVIQQKKSAPLVLGGDVLFKRSIGRTDFPNGNHHQLISGIQSKLFNLPDESTVLPGHGPTTTIGEERRHNPFVKTENDHQ